LAEPWVAPAGDGSIVRVHVRPGASRAGVAGMHGGALALRVAARPVAGAANREVLALIAAALRVPPSSLELASGARGREKRVRVHGLDPETVRARLSLASRV